MKAITNSATPATFMGAVRNIGRGLHRMTAKFAGYNAAVNTTTTRVGNRYGTNPNSTVASMQRVGMNWTAEDVAKNSCIGWAYILQRINYCSSLITYVPATGDAALDADIKQYLHGDDGCGGVFSTMGVDCSMQDAFSRTADIECPIRGDAGLIVWRDDSGGIRLVEFSADQLGEIYNFSIARYCGLAQRDNGEIHETAGNDCVYFAGRFFRGPDCVAYKIYERTNSFYANPKIYAASDVIYVRDPSSFRGVRGVTKFATAIQHMEKGERLFQIGMDAALRQAKTAMIVTNEAGAPYEGTYENDALSDGQVKYFERVPEGPLVEYFYNGDSANFTSSDSPGPELIQGVETSDERVALALGMPYAFLISPKNVSGAPSRLEVEKAAREFSRVQNKIHRPSLCRIKDVILLDAFQNKKFPYHPKLLRGRWMMPISPTVDAGYSNDENITNLRAGLECPQDLVAETNRDWDSVLLAKKQAAKDVARAVEDANRELAAEGYKPVVVSLDIAQLSDNPQQSSAAQNIDEGKSATGDNKTAKMSGYDESKHPRGQPDNAGEFGPGAGGSKTSAVKKVDSNKRSDSEIKPVGETRFNQQVLKKSHSDGIKDGNKWDNDLNRFTAAAQNGDADFPASAESPGSVDYLHWEAGFLGLDKPKYVTATRIGEIPPDGRSFNFADQRFERGVSVLNVDGQKRSDIGTFDMFNDGKKITIEGYLHHSVGSDGEPLIVGAKKVRDKE